MTQQDLIEDLFKSQKASPATAESAPLNLSEKYDDLRIQAADIAGKYADIRIDIDNLKRVGARSSSELKEQVGNLQSAAATLGNRTAQLAKSQDNIVQLLSGLTESIHTHDSQLEAHGGQIKINTATSSANDHNIQKLKRSRLTIQIVLLGAIALGLYANVGINFHSILQARDRLHTIESVLNLPTN